MEVSWRIGRGILSQAVAGATRRGRRRSVLVIDLGALALPGRVVGRRGWVVRLGALGSLARGGRRSGRVLVGGIELHGLALLRRNWGGGAVIGVSLGIVGRLEGVVVVRHGEWVVVG